jgi:hypothetical protein
MMAGFRLTIIFLHEPLAPAHFAPIPYLNVGGPELGAGPKEQKVNPFDQEEYPGGMVAPSQPNVIVMG